jgi:small-conductance mechanosensitive channel
MKRSHFLVVIGCYITQCQVKQTLHFSYSDMKRMPSVINDIKEAIREACPALISDGSRPFRVHWTDFTEDRLQVVVDCHFDLPCHGDRYWDNRQRVLIAISAALEKTGIELAVPIYTLGKTNMGDSL